MAKPIIFATLLAAASVLTTGAFNVKHAGHPNQLLFAGEALIPASPVGEGYWTDLFSPPYADCPKVMVALSCVDKQSCFIPTGVEGVGFGMTKFNATPGGTFTPMDMPNRPMMLMAIGMGTDDRPGRPARGSVGGVGLGNNPQYLKLGKTWLPSNLTADAPFFFPTQCIRASADGLRVLTVVADAIGDKSDMVLFSSDAGESFSTHRINFPLLTNRTGLRYGAMANATTWFITAGNWPRNALDDEDAVFANPIDAKLRGVDTRDVYALSERIAILRDPATGKLQHKVRDMLKKKNVGAPPALKAAGYSAQILRTTNGGKTFKSVFEELDNIYFNGIECTNVKTCYTVANGAEAVYIYGTKDGGDSWRPVFELPRTAESYYSLMSIGFLNGTVVAAGGGQSAKGYESFTVTSDDGINWSRQEGLPGIGDISAMSLIPDSGGYGFATAVTIYQTSTVLALRPKGSPTLPPAPTQATFSQINCVDDKCSEDCQTSTFPQNKCLAVTGGGSALVTCDKARSLLVQSFFAKSSQCKGNVTEKTMPLNICLHSTTGSYFENIC